MNVHNCLLQPKNALVSLTNNIKFCWEFDAGQGGGVIQGTASEAVLVVLLAARDKFLRKAGKNALEKLVVYASDQTPVGYFPS